MTDAVVFDLSRALNAYQHPRNTCGADGKWHSSMQTPQPEVLTMKEPLAQNRGLGLHEWRLQTGRTLSEIDAGECPIDLELPRLTCLRINVAPVVEAKCHVAVLLNLEYDSAPTQGVNRPDRKENGVARLRGEASAKPACGVSGARTD